MQQVRLHRLSACGSSGTHLKRPASTAASYPACTAASGHHISTYSFHHASINTQQLQHTNTSSSTQLHALSASVTSTSAASTSYELQALADLSHPTDSSDFRSSFTLHEEIGRGSYAIVYRATHNFTRQEFAVKVLSKARLEKSPHPTSRASMEASVWQDLAGSPHIVGLVAFYQDAENYFYVQELCTGGDLRTQIRTQGRLQEHEAAQVMRTLLRALAYSHHHGICIGDIKPANLLLTTPYPSSNANSKMTVKLADFGCSQRVPPTAKLTKTCGTPLYAAPELVDRRPYGVEVDMWAAGVLMYHLLTGRYPFWDMDADSVSSLSSYSILAAIKTHVPSFPKREWAHISSPAQQLIRAMLTRHPADRITAAEALQHPWLQAQQPAQPSITEKLCRTLQELQLPAGVAAGQQVVAVAYAQVA